jgi:hypothetical protein
VGKADRPLKCILSFAEERDVDEGDKLHFLIEFR